MQRTRYNIETYQKMIYRLAWSFHNTTGIEWDELVSEAYLGWCLAIKRGYNPEKASFATFIHNSIRNHLSTYVKNQYERNMTESGEYEIDELQFSEQTIEEQVSLKEQLSLMSHNAQEVCKMIFSAPHEFIVAQKPKASKSRVKEALVEFGWKPHEIWPCFNEIKETVNQV